MISSIFKKSYLPLSVIVNGNDRQFDALYPRSIRRHAEQHFTSIAVAKRTAAFLASDAGTRVLDIGSGAGKFCLIGAATTQGDFTGVEQRKDLVELSDRLAGLYRLNQVRFVHGNVLAIDFRAFDAFYLFNPFYENVRADKRIDNSVILNPSLYDSYSAYTSSRLAELPSGTRVATYFMTGTIIPGNFRKETVAEDGKLIFWKKY